MAITSYTPDPGSQAVVNTVGGMPVGLILVAPGTTITYNSDWGYSLTSYPTQEEAIQAIQDVDPSFDFSSVLGPLYVGPVNVSDPEITAYLGTDLTLNCEYECTVPGATLTYSWSGPNGDLGINTSSLSFDNLTDAYAGTYTCLVNASNSLNQTGSTAGSFTLTVTPAPNPSGVIFTGRSGASTLDLAPSYFPTLNNMPGGIDQSGLELYVPGTDTVIPYLIDPSTGEGSFDSAGNCFAPGDFRLVIRVASSGQVLGNVYPPAGPNQTIFWLYNPVVPDAPAGSGSGGVAV